ncbi:hypothetical protein Peur_064971 [Populus x canadensis]
MDWLPNQWKMKNISSSHSIQVCCLSPFTRPVLTVSGKRKAVLVSALHCCIIDPENHRVGLAMKGKNQTEQGLCLFLEQALHGASWSVSADKVYRLQRLRGMKKAKANFFHVIPLLPTSEVMDDVLEDSSAVTKDGMDGEFVELPFPPCDFEVPVSDGMLHFTTAMAKWIPNS